MNMILHNNPTALVVQGNTLADPKFKDGDTLKTFDYVVAKPHLISLGSVCPRCRTCRAP
jgi:type I restriction-modification system DNA methylase subunit